MIEDQKRERDNIIFEAYIADWREHGSPSWERISDAIPEVDLSIRQMRKIARDEFKRRGYDDDKVSEEISDKHEVPEDPPTNEDVTFRIDGDSAIAHSNNPQIKTLDQLLETCKVDLDVWQVKDWVVNAWGMGRKNEKKQITWENGVIKSGKISDTGGWAHLQNFQVKAWFVPRKIRPIELAVGELMEKLVSVAPKYNIIPASLNLDFGTVDPEFLFVPSLFDAHINKRAVKLGFTIQRAGEEYKRIVSELLRQANHMRPIKHILYIPGQDMLNADALNDTTTYGTWVDSVSDLRDAVDVVCDVATYAIEQFSLIAPVTVLPVAGNHDRYGTYWLGKFIEARFINHEFVTVINNKMPRKYFNFGKVLLGIDHGEKMRPADLALTMAVEAPKEWAASEYRGWLRGHFHKRTEMYHSITEEKGVTVQIMPALCPPDMWHVLEGFIGSKRAAEGLFYHIKNGPAGSFPVFVDELD